MIDHTNRTVRLENETIDQRTSSFPAGYAVECVDCEFVQDRPVDLLTSPYTLEHLLKAAHEKLPDRI